MGNNSKGRGIIGLGIAGILVTLGVVIGGNALTSTSLETVEAVIVKQWKDKNCRRRRRRRSCNTDYNNKVKLPNGDYRTIDRRSWFQNKKTGDTVILEKRRGGWFGNIYYKPKQG